MLLKDLMSDFLIEGPAPLPQFLSSAETDCSDEIRFAEWEEIESPRRLIKDYQFDDRTILLRFVTGLMQFEDTVGHHGKIVIDYNDVRLEVYTHDVDDITELDNEYAQYADSLFADLKLS